MHVILILMVLNWVGANIGRKMRNINYQINELFMIPTLLLRRDCHIY